MQSLLFEGTELHDCAVCSGPRADVLTSCGHHYHISCYSRWVAHVPNMCAASLCQKGRPLLKRQHESGRFFSDREQVSCERLSAAASAFIESDDFETEFTASVIVPADYILRQTPIPCLAELPRYLSVFTKQTPEALYYYTLIDFVKGHGLHFDHVFTRRLELAEADFFSQTVPDFSADRKTSVSVFPAKQQKALTLRQYHSAVGRHFAVKVIRNPRVCLEMVSSAGEFMGLSLYTCCCERYVSNSILLLKNHFFSSCAYTRRWYGQEHACVNQEVIRTHFLAEGPVSDSEDMTD
jgi:hypothetical protein